MDYNSNHCDHRVVQELYMDMIWNYCVYICVYNIFNENFVRWNECVCIDEKLYRITNSSSFINRNGHQLNFIPMIANKDNYKQKQFTKNTRTSQYNSQVSIKFIIIFPKE